ncbi:2,3,4,5-tetrahydropyridine-2,6-dicarboxylate N-acetyltransferase [Enhygromyxa salina]|uniref:2,3,4,5-tetrahydropyridine-2,6-dicarboxylate N-acetyltransferase n=1 Tax=Enhygromyxa salina TaxID=215803 RepID=A0A2S9YA93_9BACT|nr:gamma carbonic anhydrase family protein [Enhygromyxa salina]PRQ02023.1 2,3,4,5-tetrahydropyridine-2,6-dicarboxylate N-acetyltransferase [Enhygromyxa salina]
MLEPFANKLPRVDPSAFVHPAAVLIGDVVVGAQSSVWPNVTLRGDDGPIVIGSCSSIQDNTVIHCTEGLSHTVVGDRVTVGHSVILHGCTVHDEALIGMGAVLLDNAVVESGALVAAGTLVPPGKVVRAGTLVAGNPMRVMRECRDKDREMIAFSWRAYVERAAEYLSAK